jgi:hypothetical protein
MQGDIQLLLIVAGIVALGLSAANWRYAVFVTMLLVVFEGALRKWVLPEAQAALYFAKDVVLLGAYLGFAMTKGFEAPASRARPFILLLAISAVYGAVEMLHPALPSLAVAAVGWRAYFFYVPLLFIVPHLFGSLEDLHRALHRYALLALPIALLGIVQFYSPMDGAINVNVAHEEGAGGPTGFGEVDRVRVAGSFAFISGYSAYLLAVALLVGALLAGRAWSFRSNVLLYVTLVLIIAAMFATGSRSPVYSLLAASAVYALLSAAAGDLSPGAAIRAAIGAAILAAGVWNFLPEPVEAFHLRTMTADDTLSRLASPVVEPFEILAEIGLAGFGIGAAHQSAGLLVGSDYSYWTAGIVAESETSRVMLELGIVGFFLVFLFRTAIALSALRAAFMLRSRGARSLALMLAIFFGTQIFGGVIFNPTMNVLYWFAVGMLFALYRYEESDAWLAASRYQVPEGRNALVGSRFPHA